MARAPVLARLEMVSYILFPVVQTFVAAALLSMIGLAAVGTLPFWAGGPTWALAVFYLLVVGGNILACIAARRVLGVRGWVSGFILGQLYAVYSWFIGRSCCGGVAPVPAPHRLVANRTQTDRRGGRARDADDGRGELTRPTLH